MSRNDSVAATILRSHADIKEGCLQCGALAVWTDSPQVADYGFTDGSLPLFADLWERHE